MKKDKKILKTVGNNIRSIRNSIEISQEQLGFLCDLDRTYISDVELGKRNISLINLNSIADAMNVQLPDILYNQKQNIKKPPNSNGNDYIVNKKFKFKSGFIVKPEDIKFAVSMTSDRLEELPFSLFQSINLKALSGIVGAIFALFLSKRVGAIINPIEKGHPDIIPKSGKNSPEDILRNYPEGLEIKCTVGNVTKGSNLKIGQKRLPQLTGITWQAHHKDVKSLLGLIIDFTSKIKDKNFYPAITGAFYSDKLLVEDWGKISGITGRNTKVTGMKASGKRKMSEGWVILINDYDYIEKYKKIFSFNI